MISEHSQQSSSIRSLFEHIGRRSIEIVEVLGEVATLMAQSVRGLFKYRFEFREFIAQCENIGNRSFYIIALISLFTGLVMALQLVVGLGRFGLELYVGQLVGLSIFRELGPVLTAVMIAARAGSGMAAELGSMAVTEQITAIEAMGASPLQKLVIPRVLACTIVTPLLTAMADAIGALGGLIVMMMETGVSARFYIDQVTRTLVLDDFVSGIIKSAFFGFFIAIVSCRQGLNATGGTEGVGKVTTQAVVYSSVTIFVSDFFLTKLILYF